MGSRRNRVRTTGTVFVWVLLFAVSALPAVVLNSIFGYLSGLLLVSLLAFDGAYVLLAARHVGVVEQEAQVLTVSRRCETVLAVKLRNTGMLPLPQVAVTLSISDAFGNPDVEREERFALGARGTQVVPVGVRLAHIGTFDVGIRRVRVKGPLGVFSRLANVRWATRISSVPLVPDLDGLVFSQEVFLEGPRQTPSVINEGMDYAHVREYRLGDPMKVIHWKLSSHMEEYVTKTYEAYADPGVSVVLDATIPVTDAEQVMELYDLLAETALSVQRAARGQGLEGELVLLDDEGQARCLPHGGATELLEVLPVRLTSPRELQTHLLLPLLGQQMMQGTVVLVSAVVDEFTVQALLDVRRKGRVPVLLVVGGSRRLEACEPETFAALDALGIEARALTFSPDGRELQWVR